MKRNGFTLLEVIIAVAIAGMAFSALILLSGRTVETTTVSLKTTLSTIAAHNAMDEIVYMGMDKNDDTESMLNYRIKLKQDFEELMGCRIVKVRAGTNDIGMAVELYEAR